MSIITHDGTINEVVPPRSLFEQILIENGMLSASDRSIEHRRIIQAHGLDPNFVENLKYLSKKTAAVFGTSYRAGDGTWNNHESPIAPCKGVQALAPLFLNLGARETWALNHPIAEFRENVVPYLLRLRSEDVKLDYLKLVLEETYGSEIVESGIYEVLMDVHISGCLNQLTEASQRYFASKNESYNQAIDALHKRNRFTRICQSLFGSNSYSGIKEIRVLNDMRDEEKDRAKRSLEEALSIERTRLEVAANETSAATMVDINLLARYVRDAIPLTRGDRAVLQKNNPYQLLFRLPVETRAFMTGVLMQMEQQGKIDLSGINAKTEWFPKPVMLEDALEYGKRTGMLDQVQKHMHLYNKVSAN